MHPIPASDTEFLYLFHNVNVFLTRVLSGLSDVYPYTRAVRLPKTWVRKEHPVQ